MYSFLLNLDGMVVVEVVDPKSGVTFSMSKLDDWTSFQVDGQSHPFGSIGYPVTTKFQHYFRPLSESTSAYLWPTVRPYFLSSQSSGHRPLPYSGRPHIPTLRTSFVEKVVSEGLQHNTTLTSLSMTLPRPLSVVRGWTRRRFNDSLSCKTHTSTPSYWDLHLCV